MFTFQETLWQLTRNRARTVILLLAREESWTVVLMARSFRIDPVYLLSTKDKV